MDVPYLLTKSQYKILRGIKDFRRSFGYSPSIRELVKISGIKSVSHVHYLLIDLEEKGIIVRTPGVARSILLTDDSGKKDPGQLLGAIDREGFGVPGGTL